MNTLSKEEIEQILQMTWNKRAKKNIDDFDQDIYCYGIKTTDINSFLVEINKYNIELKYLDVIKNRTIHKQSQYILSKYKNKFNKNTVIEEKNKYEILKVEQNQELYPELLGDVNSEFDLEKKLDFFASVDDYVSEQKNNYISDNTDRNEIVNSVKWFGECTDNTNIKWIQSKVENDYGIYLSPCIEFDVDNFQEWKSVALYCNIFQNFCKLIEVKRLKLDFNKMYQNKPIQLVYQTAHQLAVSICLIKCKSPNYILGCGIGEYIGLYLIGKITLDHFLYIIIKSVYYLTLVINKSSSVYFSKYEPKQNLNIINCPNGYLVYGLVDEDDEYDYQKCHFNNMIYTKPNLEHESIMTRLFQKYAKIEKSNDEDKFTYISGSIQDFKSSFDINLMHMILFTPIKWNDVLVELMNFHDTNLVSVCQHECCYSLMKPFDNCIKVRSPFDLTQYCNPSKFEILFGYPLSFLKSTLSFHPFRIHNSMYKSDYDTLLILFHNFSVVEELLKNSNIAEKNIYTVYVQSDWMNDNNFEFLKTISDDCEFSIVMCKIVIDENIPSYKYLLEVLKNNINSNFLVVNEIFYHSTESINEIIKPIFFSV